MANGKRQRPTGGRLGQISSPYLSLGNNLGTGEVSSTSPKEHPCEFCSLQATSYTVLIRAARCWATLPICPNARPCRARQSPPIGIEITALTVLHPPPPPRSHLHSGSSGFFRKKEAFRSLQLQFQFPAFSNQTFYLPSKTLDALIKLASRAILNKPAPLFYISIRLSRGLPTDRVTQWD